MKKTLKAICFNSLTLVLAFFVINGTLLARETIIQEKESGEDVQLPQILVPKSMSCKSGERICDCQQTDCDRSGRNCRSIKCECCKDLEPLP